MPIKKRKKPTAKLPLKMKTKTRPLVANRMTIKAKLLQLTNRPNHSQIMTMKNSPLNQITKLKRKRQMTEKMLKWLPLMRALNNLKKLMSNKTRRQTMQGQITIKTLMRMMKMRRRKYLSHRPSTARFAMRISYP